MSAHLDGESQLAANIACHQGRGGGGHRQQRRGRGGGGGGNGPTLPLLSNPADLLLDTHPDGSRTTPAMRSWQHMTGGNRGGMYSHSVMSGNNNPGGSFEHGGGGRGGQWAGGNKGLLHHQQHQQQQQSGGNYNNHHHHHNNNNNHHGGGGAGGGGAGVRRSLGTRTFNNKGGGGSATSGSPATSLGLIRSVTGESIQFTETNMDWTKLNIFRTRLCDRLTQMHSCHMANRCLFSHDIAWPRRTPFLPRATALTLRYIPVWCPRVPWPPLSGVCDSLGKISWSSAPSSDGTPYDPSYAHTCCIRGDNCPFVHNLEEFLYHPEVYKTRMCCLANDDNLGDENGNCLCPWYFCPFAHYLYELRDVRQAKMAWHPPPQIVDNHFVARTQGFDDVELTIIQYVRKSPNGSIDLYLRQGPGGPQGLNSAPNLGAPGGSAVLRLPLTGGSSTSAIRDLLFGRHLLPPVFRPIIGSSLEHLIASEWHRKIEFDDLLYLLVQASLLNLVLYPVENFYVPALLSLQNAAIEYQLDLSATDGPGGIAGKAPRETSELLALYDKIALNSQEGTPLENDRGSPSGPSTGPPPGVPVPVVNTTQHQDPWAYQPDTLVDPRMAASGSQADPTSPTHSNLSANRRGGNSSSQLHRHPQRSSSPLLSIDQVSQAEVVSLPAPFSFLPATPNAQTSPASSSWRGAASESNSPNSVSRFFGSGGRYDLLAGSSPSTTTTAASTSPSKGVVADGSEQATVPAKLTSTSECDLESFLESLCPEDLLRVVELFTNENVANPAEGGRKKSWESSGVAAATTADEQQSAATATPTVPDLASADAHAEGDADSSAAKGEPAVGEAAFAGVQVE